MAAKQLLRGGVILTVGNVTGALAGFARNIIVARLVSVEDFGVAALLALSMSLVEMASNLAVDNFLVRERDGGEERVQATAQAFQMLRGLLCGLLLFVAAPYLAALFEIAEAAWAFQVLALVPVVRGFAHLDYVRHQRDLHFVPSVLVGVLPQLLALSVAIPLGLWLGDFSVMLWIIVLQAVAYVGLSHVIAGRAYRWAWDRTVISRMVDFGWPLLLNGFLLFLILQGDRALVGAAFSMTELGLYSAAYLLSLQPTVLIAKVCQTLLLPLLANARGESRLFEARVVLTLQACFFLGFLFSAAFVVLGPYVYLLVYGDRYAAGAGIVALLGVLHGLRVVRAGPTVPAIALGRTANPLLSNVVRSTGLALALAAVALGGGLPAVVIAGITAEFAALLVSYGLLYRSTPLAPSAVLLWPLLFVPGIALVYGVAHLDLVAGPYWARAALVAIVLSVGAAALLANPLARRAWGAGFKAWQMGRSESPA